MEKVLTEELKKKRQKTENVLQRNGRLTHLWKESPTAIDIVDQGHFDHSNGRWLLRLWTSTATVCRCRLDNGSAHIICSPDYWDSSKGGDESLFRSFSEIGLGAHLAPFQPEIDRLSDTVCPEHNQAARTVDLVVIGRNIYKNGGRTVDVKDEVYMP
jgi:hypothetical protein